MEFHAYHGCFEEERQQGNLFVVDFRGEYAAKKAAKSDSLTLAIDYGEVYKVVREQMEIPSNLLENVAWRIVDALHKQFPAFSSFSVTVSKQNPPVGGDCRWARVTLEWPGHQKSAK